MRYFENASIRQRSLFSKLFTITKAPVSLDVTFSDGGKIPQAYLAEIDAAYETATLTVQGRGVLDNDSDVDGDALTITLVKKPENGALVMNE
ncbi:MAG: cadherin-like domain-containing protein, partial [Gammaproteobacteria bacterium]